MAEARPTCPRPVLGHHEARENGRGRSSDINIMTPHSPNFNRAWRRTFWQVYDNLGLLILSSLLWLVFSFTILLLPIATAAIFYIAYLIALDKPVNIKNYFLCAPKYFFRSALIIFSMCAVFLALAFNMKFYIKHFGILGLILSGITFWLFLFSVMALIYIFPLITRDKHIWETLRYSYILVFDNFKITLQLLIYLVFFLFLEIILPIIGIGLLAVFFQNSFLEIISRYNPDMEITEPRRKFRELWRVWDFSP